MPDKCPVCGRFTKVVSCPEAELGFGIYCSNCNITGRTRASKSSGEPKKRMCKNCSFICHEGVKRYKIYYCGILGDSPTKRSTITDFNEVLDNCPDDYLDEIKELGNEF